MEIPFVKQGQRRHLNTRARFGVVQFWSHRAMMLKICFRTCDKTIVYKPIRCYRNRRRGFCISPVPPIFGLPDFVESAHVTPRIRHCHLRLCKKRANGGDGRKCVGGIELHEDGADVNGDKTYRDKQTAEHLRLWGGGGEGECELG